MPLENEVLQNEGKYPTGVEPECSGSTIPISSRWPIAHSSRPRPRRWRATTSWCSPCPTARAVRSPPPCRRTPWSSTAGRTTGSSTPRPGRPSTTGRTRAAGRTVRRAAAGRGRRGATRCAGPPCPVPAATRRPRRWPGAGSRRRPARTGRRRRRGVLHLGAGRPPAAPARHRDYGVDDAVRRRRRAPPYARDRAEPLGRRRVAGPGLFTPVWPRCPAASSRPASRASRPGPGSRGPATSASCGPRPMPTSRSCRSSPRGGGRDRRHRRARTPCTCRSLSTSARAGCRHGRRSTTSRRAPRGGPAVRQPRARPARDARPAAGGGGAVSVTAPRRLPRRRRHRGAQGDRRAGPRARRQRRPLRARRRRSTRPTGCRPRPCCGREQAIADGRLEAVVLNSGGANACTGPEGFADTHATAERVAAALGWRRVTWPCARPA